MTSYSIFNDVLGPVMHGPSSSHTAASYRIGRLCRDLLNEEPVTVDFLFDQNGSYGRVYHEQGSDLGFVTGVMGWSITDDRFFDALTIAEESGLKASFNIGCISEDAHPNAVQIKMTGKKGRILSVNARSIGGGMIEVIRLNQNKVHLTGSAYDALVYLKSSDTGLLENKVLQNLDFLREPIIEVGESPCIHMKLKTAPSEEILSDLASDEDVEDVFYCAPLFFIKQGEPMFSCADDMLRHAARHGMSLGRLAMRYECELLGLDEVDVIDEMKHRWEIMADSVHQGLSGQLRPMRLLKPSAPGIMRAESEKKLAIGGLHSKAAARAMAAMHVNSGMGLVCAAPTGGSAGVLPGVLVSMLEDLNLPEDVIIRALFAAAAVGIVILMRGDTFAAELAGCQVEIGAAGAMAAAAVVEAFDGSARQAADAAAISLQNTMGSVCDLVQGVVEIPCHTRNAVAASSAFVCADLILGGYENPVTLDDSADASLEVGKALKSEYRCTAKGGIAITPSALSMKRIKN